MDAIRTCRPNLYFRPSGFRNFFFLYTHFYIESASFVASFPPTFLRIVFYNVSIVSFRHVPVTAPIYTRTLRIAHARRPNENPKVNGATQNLQSK